MRPILSRGMTATKQPRSSHRTTLGFTLIEMMAVLIVMVLLLGMVLPRLIRGVQLKLDSTASKLASLIRYLHNQAALENRMFRLVVDFEKREIHTEVAEQIVLLEETRDAVRGKAPPLSSLGEGAEESPYSGYTSYLTEPIRLPKGIKIEAILIADSETEIRDGVTYLSFFPYGRTEQIIVRLADESGDNMVSIEISPLTGRVTLFDSKREIDELPADES